MPPIQVYRNSPINAAKPDGPNPETAEQGKTAAVAQQLPPPTTTTSAATNQASSQYQPAYPAAQPGAVPSLPVPTGVANLPNLQPTPTRSLDTSNNPPAPQPGAVPTAPGASGGNGGSGATLPPPPKAGESLQQGSSQTTTTMPPQMSYSLPGAGAPQQHGSFTSTAPEAVGYPAPGPTSLMEGGASAGYGHNQPMGYQPGYSIGQQQQSSYRGADDDEESIWGTAKKWASAAGEQLAHAESEVWKKINKD